VIASDHRVVDRSETLLLGKDEPWSMPASSSSPSSCSARDSSSPPAERIVSGHNHGR
jgi:hypothetical protein